MEDDDPLWRTLKEGAETRRRRRLPVDYAASDLKTVM